jgi:hypothetical protein
LAATVGAVRGVGAVRRVSATFFADGTFPSLFSIHLGAVGSCSSFSFLPATLRFLHAIVAN